MAKQMKALRVTEDVKLLAEEVRKSVAVESGGEVVNLNDSVRYVFQNYLERVSNK